MDRQQLLQRLDRAWAALQDSYAGLPDARLLEPGVAGEWSVRDILAHVTTWEEEALKDLPVIAAGGRPPPYRAFGGLDAFNAQMAAQRRGLPLAEVRRQAGETHARLLAYLGAVAEEQFAGETRFRHRLRLDTYSHYALHARMIREWRERQGV
jgi:hypothetical protein